MTPSLRVHLLLLDFPFVLLSVVILMFLFPGVYYSIRILFLF